MYLHGYNPNMPSGMQVDVGFSGGWDIRVLDMCRLGCSNVAGDIHGSRVR